MDIVKGCNKVRKTSRKYCAEHKKDGMVIIMYQHYNNQVDQVFKELPRELQWEILVDFVGGYMIRYNRLRRLFSGELHKHIMEHNFELNELSLYRLWLKPLVEYPIPPIQLIHALNRAHELNFTSNGQLWEGENDPENLLAIASAEFSRRDVLVVLFKSKHTGQLSYGYYSWSRHWYITKVDDSITLPPYEKHVYPSYPHTNKKLGRPLLKMKLHNPIPKVPSGLNYKEIKEWVGGRRFRY